MQAQQQQQKVVMYFNPCKVHYITSLGKLYNRFIKGTAWNISYNKDESKTDLDITELKNDCPMNFQFLR